MFNSSDVLAVKLDNDLYCKKRGRLEPSNV